MAALGVIITMTNQTSKQWAMCPPQYFGVEYVINPWMEGQIGRANNQVAQRQWQALYDILSTRANVHLIPAIRGLPDMTFTANAGLVLGNTFVPSTFRFPQRQPEENYFIQWFREQGYNIVDLGEEGTFEGEGDALFQPGEQLLWAGYGVRSALVVHTRLCEIFDVEVISLRLVDQRFYHLDTCFAPLDDGCVVYYPRAFDEASLELLHARVPPQKRLAVSDEDALNFSCNGVVSGETYICNQPTESFCRHLKSWGYEVIATPLSEFMLAGGAAKCLSLCLTQEVPAHTTPGAHFSSAIADCTIELQGHILDNGLMTGVLDAITDAGGHFEIPRLQAGLRRDQESLARIHVFAPTAKRLEILLQELLNLGARLPGIHSSKLKTL